MAFKPAKQFGNAGGSGQTFTNENLVLKPEAKLTYITTRLSSMENITEFRIIPSFDGDGVMETPLNPEYVHGSSIHTLIGGWACNLEIADNLGIPHAMTFISAVSGDANGNKPEEKFSPTNMVIWNVKWKIREMLEREKLGLPMDGQPKTWMKYGKGRYPFMNLGDTKQAWLVQGLCRQLDGQVFRNDAKQAILRPNFVLQFNGDLFENMADSIGMKYDPDKPLSPETCSFGDFITPAGGHTIIFSKFMKQDPQKPDRGRPSYKVSLNPRGALPVQEEHCRKFFQPWEQVLHIPTIEESIGYLVKALGPDMVDFGLRGTNYEKYLEADVSGASHGIPDTVKLTDLRNSAPAQNAAPAQQAAAPTHAPGHPAYTEAPAASGGYALPDDGDDIAGLEKKPTPPSFPQDKPDVDDNGQVNPASTTTYVDPDLSAMPDMPSASDDDYTNILNDVHNAQG